MTSTPKGVTQQMSPSPTSNNVYQVNPAIGIGQQYNMTLYDVLNYGYDLGLADYPIWDESKRQWLNDLIVNHFMWREIRGETPYQFIYFLNRRMVEHMPTLNPIFATLESISADELSRTSRSKTDHVSDSTVNGSQTADAYSSRNPKETMVDKDPTLYYDAGQHNTGHNSAANHLQDSYKNDTYGNAVMGLQQWALGVNNALEMLFTSLEVCFCQLVRPNINVY